MNDELKANLTLIMLMLHSQDTQISDTITVSILTLMGKYWGRSTSWPPTSLVAGQLCPLAFRIAKRKLGKFGGSFKTLRHISRFLKALIVQ